MIGTMMIWGGTTNNIPEGWLLCDGQEFDQNTYAELYAILGNKNTTPNMANRLPEGHATQTNIRSGASLTGSVNHGTISGSNNTGNPNRNVSMNLNISDQGSHDHEVTWDKYQLYGWRDAPDTGWGHCVGDGLAHGTRESGDTYSAGMHVNVGRYHTHRINISAEHNPGNHSHYVDMNFSESHSHSSSTYIQSISYSGNAGESKTSRPASYRTLYIIKAL